MDVYSQSQQRAHGTGFVGVDADSDDSIDTLEVYEALINPRESERGGSGQSGPGMMPPMMGMGGAGAGSGATAQAGMASQSTAVAAAAQASGLRGLGVAPSASGAAVASPGVGSMPSGAGGGGGLSAAGLEPSAGTAGEPVAGAQELADGAPQTEAAPVPEADPMPMATSRLAADVTSVDPAQVDRVAREWSDLASQMEALGVAAAELQTNVEDFGLVKQPAGFYGEMTSGFQQLAGGASQEFDQIAHGLSYGAQAYRDQESAAAQSLRSAK